MPPDVNSSIGRDKQVWADLRKTALTIVVGPERKKFHTYMRLVSTHSSVLKDKLNPRQIVINLEDPDDVPVLDLPQESAQHFEWFRYFMDDHSGNDLWTLGELTAMGFTGLVDLYNFGIRLRAKKFQNEVINAFHRLKEHSIIQIEEQIAAIAEGCKSKVQRRALLENMPRPQPANPLSIAVVDDTLRRIPPRTKLHAYLVDYLAFSLIPRTDRSGSAALETLPSSVLWATLNVSMATQAARFSNVVGLDDDHGERIQIPEGLSKALMLEWIFASAAALRDKLVQMHRGKGGRTGDFFGVRTLCKYHGHESVGAGRRCKASFEVESDYAVFDDQARMLDAVEAGVGAVKEER